MNGDALLDFKAHGFHGEGCTVFVPAGNRREQRTAHTAAEQMRGRRYMGSRSDEVAAGLTVR